MRTAADEPYPGRMIADEERTAFGLGWEYARRGWSPDQCPLVAPAKICDFLAGYQQFKCQDPKVSAAMLGRGVPATLPLGGWPNSSPGRTR